LRHLVASRTRLGILFGTVAGFLAALASIISPNGVFLFLINTSGAIILFIYTIIAFGRSGFASSSSGRRAPAAQDVVFPMAQLRSDHRHRWCWS